MTRTMTQSASEQILRDIQAARELTSRSRELLKHPKSETHNDSSRQARVDGSGVEVSKETCLLAQGQAPAPAAVPSLRDPLGETSSQEAVPQERGVSNHAPRELSSRYSGITVQHVKTTKGVKLSITLQQPAWRHSGACQAATAELKRYDRMREVKARPSDSDRFVQYLNTVKQQLHANHAVNTCIGRLHERGKRTTWLHDALAVAEFECDKLVTVMLYLAGEVVYIPLNLELSESQTKYYHAHGILGEIVNGQVPTLDDLPLKKFGRHQ